MRLTLRTLLAWIDAVLPATEQDELGTKVAASPVAPKLVERIAQAVESATLPAPAGQGPADEPNAVAEFLDNVLPAEELEAFERACLESQVHLSEVASCHRLLAEAAREAALTGPLAGDQRRRLIRAVAEGMSHEPDPSTADEAADEMAVVAIETDRRAAPAARPPSERASVWAWLSAVAAIALVVVLGAVLARSIWPPVREPEQAKPAVAAIEPGSAPATDRADASDEPPVDAAAMTEAEEDARPVASAPTESEAAAPTSIAALPTTDPVPLPPMEALSDEPQVDAAPIAESDVEPTPPPPGRVGPGDPVLRLVAREAGDQWRPTKAGDPLAADVELLVPARCFPVLEHGDLRIRLLPGTKAALVTADDGLPRLEVVFGRGVVWTDAPAGARLGVSAAGLCGTASLGPRQPLGIEVRLEHRPGDDPAAVSPGHQANVFATGGIDWQQTGPDGSPAAPLIGIEPTQAVPPAGRLEWSSSDPAAARLASGGREPDWLRQAAPVDRLGRGARAAVARCLEATPAEQSVSDSLRELATDRRVENRLAAVSTLALLGDYDELVGQLCLDRGPAALSETQWQALVAETIPLALGRGANAAARLRQAFLARGPAGRGDELFRLACGLGPDELAAGGAEPLVASLEDPELVIRRFALANLLPLAGAASEPAMLYRPDRAASLNEKGVAWWQKRVATAGDDPAAAP